jgi:3-deoxy-manno-octulosonate cytidylyltransferase (CMP-KDO synthetase)
MENIIVIPARYGSSRFPGKPLHRIKGLTLIERVWRIAAAAQGANRVVVATDDDRIYQTVSSFGGEVVMTDERCSNGSERCLDAIRKLGVNPSLVVNLQGDAVLMPPWIISDLIFAMNENQSAAVATPAVRLSWNEYSPLVAQKSGGTYVVFDSQKNALYFSRYPVPFVRNRPEESFSPVFKHIGLYAYRLHMLEQYLSLPKGELEQIEGLEQLRFLENGLKIKVVETDYRGRRHCSIDYLEDVKRAEEIIEQQGELFSI